MSLAKKNLELVSSVDRLERCLRRIFQSLPPRFHGALIRADPLLRMRRKQPRVLATTMIRELDEEHRDQCLTRLWHHARKIRMSLQQQSAAQAQDDILRQAFVLRNARPCHTARLDFSQQPPFRLIFPNHRDDSPIRLFIPHAHYIDFKQRHAFLAQYAALEWDVEDQRFRITSLIQDHFHVHPNKFDASLVQSQLKYVCEASQLLGGTLHPLERKLMTRTCQYFRQLLPVLDWLRDRSTHDTASEIWSYLVTNQEMQVFLSLNMK